MLTCDGGRLVEGRVQRLGPDEVLRVHFGAVVDRVEAGELRGGEARSLNKTQDIEALVSKIK